MQSEYATGSSVTALTTVVGYPLPDNTGNFELAVQKVQQIFRERVAARASSRLI